MLTVFSKQRSASEESAAMKASNTAMEKSKVNLPGSHRLGAHPPRKMSQMSITSFFGRLASKKVEGGERCEGMENSVKTKKTAVNPAFKRKSIIVQGEAKDPSNKHGSAENPNHKFTEEKKKCMKPMETSSDLPTANGMENLAPEILIKIFGFLPFDDLKSAIVVCRFVLRVSPKVDSLYHIHIVSNFARTSFGMRRWWREVGESPSLWANLKLSYMDHKFSLKLRLPKVLALKRLQSLKSLNVGYVVNDCANYLRMISADHPSVRRISLDIHWVIDEDNVANIAETLAKFDEVDLSKGECKVGNTLYGHSVLVKAILHASTEGDSKLKILKMRFDAIQIFDYFLKMEAGGEEIFKACFKYITEYKAKYGIKVNIVPQYLEKEEDEKRMSRNLYYIKMHQTSKRRRQKQKKEEIRKNRKKEETEKRRRQKEEEKTKKKRFFREWRMVNGKWRGYDVFR